MPFSGCEFVKVGAVKATRYLRQQIQSCLYSVYFRSVRIEFGTEDVYRHLSRDCEFRENQV